MATWEEHAAPTGLAVAEVGLKAAVDQHIVVIVVVAGAVVVVQRPHRVVVGDDEVLLDDATLQRPSSAYVSLGFVEGLPES